jgi:hypothetical protein
VAWEAGADARIAAEGERHQQELDDAGYVPDEEIVADEVMINPEPGKPAKWDGGEAVAKEFFRRQKELSEKREANRNNDYCED